MSEQPLYDQARQVPSEPVHRLSVKQYHLMVSAGILTPDDGVELLEGWLVTQKTKNPPHRIATHNTTACLEAVIPSAWYVDAQEPIVTVDSEPEPDVAVIRGKTEDYATSNPSAALVGLVVEVADVTLLRDRQVKGRIYGRAQIPFYWIVNLVERQLEVYESPSESGYRDVSTHPETALEPDRKQPDQS
jgi:Uma2 family endonuclease